MPSRQKSEVSPVLSKQLQNTNSWGNEEGAVCVCVCAVGAQLNMPSSHWYPLDLEMPPALSSFLRNSSKSATIRLKEKKKPLPAICPADTVDAAFSAPRSSPVMGCSQISRTEHSLQDVTSNDMTPIYQIKRQENQGVTEPASSAGELGTGARLRDTRTTELMQKWEPVGRISPNRFDITF